VKRIIALAALVLSLAALGIPAAQAYQGSEEMQFVSGSIEFPTRFADTASGDTSAGWPGLVRRWYDATGSDGNGLIGYVFPIDPATIGGSFTLTLTGQSAANNADLDIYLYNEIGDTAGSVTPVTTAEYATHSGTGETGFVAPDSRYGVVFMANGLHVTFDYVATQAAGVEVSESGFAPADLTIGAGGWVNFQNAGQDFHSATASDGSFDTSPDAKHPLRPGDSQMVQFLTQGDYTYYDRYSTATGVIHVVAGPGPGTPAA
jgi:plastocyanin